MARDPNRPNPDESVNRHEPAEVPPADQRSQQPSERAPQRDADIETGRESGRGNEGIE